MDDDLNTADAIAVLFELTRAANAYIAGQVWRRKEIEAFLRMFDELAQVLGLILTADDQLLDEEIEKLIQERKEARLRRDFARADEIRDLLKEKGILLEDTPQGVRWRREK